MIILFYGRSFIHHKRELKKRHWTSVQNYYFIVYRMGIDSSYSIRLVKL